MDPHTGLNTLDYFVIGIILLSGLLALMRGFTREMLSLAAWIGAYFSAVKFYPLVTPWMHHYIKNDKAAEWGAMAVVYLVSLILLIAAGSLIAHYLVRGRALTSIDRSLGFLYGLLRGTIVLCLVYMGAVMILWPDIDKPAQEQQPVVSQTEPQQDKGVPTEAQQDKGHYVVPEMLMEAKTRRFLAFGAQKLSMLIPKEMIDKTLKDYITEKENGQKEINQHALDMLSTPAPQTNKPVPDNAPEHLDINKILNQGNAP